MVEITIYQQIETIEKMGDPAKIYQGLRKSKSVTDEPDLDRLKVSNTFEKNFDNIKDRVESILKRDKFARKNDVWLMLVYYAQMGYINLKIDINAFDKINPPESISRARRSLFEEIKQGQHPELKHLIDHDMEQIRKECETNYHDYFQEKKNSNMAKIVK